MPLLVMEELLSMCVCGMISDNVQWILVGGVSLHGSLASDMDIMAMPWVEEADTFECLIDKISKLFSDNDLSKQYVITDDEKPH